MLIHLAFDSELLAKVEMAELLTTMTIGFFICLGQIFINSAIVIGKSSISTAIMHTKTITVTLFNYFVFSQAMSMSQGVAIGMAFIGALVISIAEKNEK